MSNPLAIFGIPNFAWDILALVITFIVIFLLIKINDWLRVREKIPLDISRKMVHTFMGPVYILCWLLFSHDALSRYFAAVVPVLFAIIFVAIGTGVIQRDEFVKTMSRSGEAQELLFGSFLYSLVLVWLTIACWFVPVTLPTAANPLVSPTGEPVYAQFVPTAILVIAPLAGGDGFADIIGRKWGKRKYKIFAEKSIEGSLAMFIFSFVFSYVILGIYWLIYNPLYPEAFSLLKLLVPILIISLVATVVEACSPKNFDNLLVPAFIFVTIWGLQMLYYWELFNALPLWINYPWKIWTFTPV
ncbi:MAG: diacylglycerol/polyprenol kinase family protein [Promethearchaeota archaeon]